MKCLVSQECIVVCVVSLEELKITPGNVPYEQCREIRTEAVGKGAKKLDWIIIPASAAIVATVIIAVIIFIACIKSSHKSREAKVSWEVMGEDENESGGPCWLLNRSSDQSIPIKPSNYQILKLFLIL